MKPRLPQPGPLNVAVLFVDLVNSSEFASVLGLREYAEYLDSFQHACLSQCRHFFESVHKGKYQQGLDYRVSFIGDELVVFLHSGRDADDIYQLACLAICLKCAWLASPKNTERIQAGMGTVDIACGIHFGSVWANPQQSGYDLRGFTINVAKRIETSSREGKNFHIFLSDAAYKRISQLLRNLLVGEGMVLPMKGVIVPVGVYEIEDSFIDPYKRLDPEFSEGFQNVARSALESNACEAWIHSCLQVWEESRNGKVTDECFDLCRRTLKSHPENAVAMYFIGQACQERKDPERARLYLEDLTRFHPTFADGWLLLAEVCKSLGDAPSSRKAILQAERHGIQIEQTD